jgi:putative addiction module component (TIGR02574 family)
LPAEEPADLDLDHGEAWEREIDRRMEEVRTGQVETIPAEEVFAAIDADLARRAQERAGRTVGKSRR